MEFTDKELRTIQYALHATAVKLEEITEVLPDSESEEMRDTIAELAEIHSKIENRPRHSSEEDTPLYKFCLLEARYRVTEMESEYEPFNTTEEMLKAYDVDVEEFISDYARELFDNSEEWVDSDSICYIMDNQIRDAIGCDL